MKKYEYRYMDLSPTWTLNPEKKMTELVERLNTLGQEGWVIVSGLEIVKYAVFVRETPVAGGHRGFPMSFSLHRKVRKLSETPWVFP